MYVYMYMYMHVLNMRVHCSLWEMWYEYESNREQPPGLLHEYVCVQCAFMSLSEYTWEGLHAYEQLNVHVHVHACVPIDNCIKSYM